MRILRVAQNLYPEVPGGGTYHVHVMSCDQAAMGHEVTVLTVSRDETLPRREERAGYTVVRRSPTVEALGNEISVGVARVFSDAEDFDTLIGMSTCSIDTSGSSRCRGLGWSNTWANLACRADIVSNEFNTTWLLYSPMPSQQPEQNSEEGMAELRDEYPSGWRILTQHESVGYMIDVLMDAPDYHFSKSKLAEDAGVSRQSVHTHLPLLLRLDIVAVVEDSSPETYTLNSGDELVQELHRLNGLVNKKLDAE
ncbi:MAG: hypothetical protein ABEH88_11220 [Halobacteriales archaeon]